MEDIIMQVPSYCDDCETWHQEFVWVYDDGTYTICDTDGNHEPLDASEVPTGEENDKAWHDYRAWVLETGQDPLGEFMVKHSIKTKERWQFRITKTLVGPRLIDARRGKQRYPLYVDRLPEHVKSFLNLDASGKLGDFATWDELIAVLPDIKAGRWFVAHIEHDAPRQETVIARDLRKAARRALKDI